MQSQFSGLILNMTIKLSPQETAQKIYLEKFPDCAGILLAGSVMRGEGTPSSDLDIVVIYERLDNAWRDSFHFEGWPVEVFVHDLETLNYFFQSLERPSGVPSLPSMVIEGKMIPSANPILEKAKNLAKKVVDAGPIPWTEKEIMRGRYNITDICDDMKSPRSDAELIASGVRLYEVITDFYFRSKNKWSAKGKSIPRRWRQENEDLAEKFIQAFEDLFQRKTTNSVMRFAEEVLTPYGGWLFENSKISAPSEWRKLL
ncbi:MAG: nucleotidyltransferase domain-containing protein [Bacteriovoracaceae bacterium]